MDVAGEIDLAWDLAATVSACLDEAPKAELFVKIGAGVVSAAITDALYVAAVSGVALPGDLVSRCHAWLDCYVGGEQEPALRRLLRMAAGGVADS
jgi:hypothetical protein